MEVQESVDEGSQEKEVVIPVAERLKTELEIKEYPKLATLDPQAIIDVLMEFKEFEQLLKDTLGIKVVMLQSCLTMEDPTQLRETERSNDMSEEAVEWHP